MKKTEYTSKHTNLNKAFTLVEVLIVITLISLVFSVLAFSFYSSVKNSLDISKKSQEIKNLSSFFWDMERKFSTSNTIYLKNLNSTPILTLYNTSGYNKGLVKSVFFLKDGFLHYYEYPYIYADPFFYDEKNSYRLFKVENIKIYAVKDYKQMEEFQGMPDYLVFEINGLRMVFK
jgi:prepilin-type N-terminal cleavage/methylation domain-containing protein